MDIDSEKIRKLKVDSVITINGNNYKVIEAKRGIRVSNLYNDYVLLNDSGEKYFLQLNVGKSLNFWKIEIDPAEGKPVLSSENAIEIQSVECQQ
jgi:hypothetical protein